MNKPLRNMTAMAVLLAVGTLASAHRAAAEAPKPALTIAFAGYDQLIGDLKALEALSGHAKLAAMFEANIKAQTHDKGLVGLDKSRPWGGLVFLGEDDQPVVQGFLPATDLKQLLAAIPLPGGDAPTAKANGVYELPVNDKTVYLKQKGKWAVFSFSEETLDSALADPTPALADLTKKYLLAVRGSVQNVPAARRESTLNSLRGIVEIMLLAMQQQANSDEERAMQAAGVKQMFAKLERLSKELDTAVIGVGLDRSSKSLFLDFEARAVAGTDLAKKFGALKDAKTDLAGFALPGAAMTMLSAGTSDDDDVAEIKTTLANLKAKANKLLDDNDQLEAKKRDLAKKLLGDILGVFEKTAELKKSEFGMAVVAEDAPAVVAGLRIAEGAKLESTLKELVDKLADDEPKLKELVKFDAEKDGDVNFHVVKIPLTDPDAAKVFGDPLQIVVGISPSRLYFGAGKEPITTIKKAIEASKAAPGKAIDAVDLVISGEPIAKFFAKVLSDDNPSEGEAKKNFAKAAASFAKSGGKDHVTMVVKAIPDSVTLRLNVESGITKAILDLLPGIGAEDADEK